MPLTRNIDEHGAHLRRIWGVLMIFLGLAAGAVAAWTGIIALWIVTVLGVALGGFAFFEAREKWCVMRAMGVKTPH